MRLDFKYRHIPPNDELTTYAQERLTRLEKFQVKPIRVEITFSLERATMRVEILIRGPDIEMHAHAEADNFFKSIDDAIDRVARQLERKKARVKTHKGSWFKAS